MFTTTYNFAPAHPLLRRKPEKKHSTEEKERLDRTVQPETRLWKLTSKAVRPKMAWGELLVLWAFLAVVVSATGLSVQELSRLMKSDAIEHVTARALQSAQ
jgi:hypothetical protein